MITFHLEKHLPNLLNLAFEPINHFENNRERPFDSRLRSDFQNVSSLDILHDWVDLSLAVNVLV